MIDVMTPDQFAHLIFNALLLLTSGFASAPITTFAVSLLKRIVPDSVPADYLNFVVALVLTVASWIATRVGVALQFQSVLDFILQIAPPIIALLATFRGAQALYTQAVDGSMPVLGYKRS